MSGGVPLGTRCPSCGGANPPGAAFCTLCGFRLQATGPFPAPPTPPAFAPVRPFDYGSGIPQGYRSRDEDRTVSGLLWMIIGSLLSWIPYVSALGGLFVLIGIILLFLGRYGYGEAHRQYVVAAGVLILLGLIGAVVASVAFVASIVSQATVPGVTPSQIGGSLQSDLLGLVVSTFVLGVLATLGQVLIVYRISDRESQRLLWAGFFTGMALNVARLVYLLPLISTAISQATSGSTINLGPINALETTSTLLGLTSVLPCVLFAWAYYRVRERIMKGELGVPGALPSPFPR